MFCATTRPGRQDEVGVAREAAPTLLLRRRKTDRLVPVPDRYGKHPRSPQKLLSEPAGEVNDPNESKGRKALQRRDRPIQAWPVQSRCSRETGAVSVGKRLKGSFPVARKATTAKPQGGEEKAAHFGCDPEDLPATGTVHGGSPDSCPKPIERGLRRSVRSRARGRRSRRQRGWRRRGARGPALTRSGLPVPSPGIVR